MVEDRADDRVVTALGDIELRLARLESRLGEPGTASGGDGGDQLQWMFAPLVPGFVFAWLSGQTWAWGAMGAIGVAAMAGFVVLMLRRR